MGEKKGRTCHAACKGRPYCAVRHAELCKKWHDDRRKAAGKSARPKAAKAKVKSKAKAVKTKNEQARKDRLAKKAAAERKRRADNKAKAAQAAQATA